MKRTYIVGLVTILTLAFAAIFNSCDQAAIIKGSAVELTSTSGVLTLAKNSVKFPIGLDPLPIEALIISGYPPYTYQLSGNGSLENGAFNATEEGLTTITITDSQNITETLVIESVSPAITADFRNKTNSLLTTPRGLGALNYRYFVGGQAGSPASYTDVTGTLRISADSQTPRFDHDPLRCENPAESITTSPNCERKYLGVLLEGQATNIVLNSENYAINTWTLTNLVLDPSIAAGPFPARSGRFRFTSASSTPVPMISAATSVARPASTSYAVSFYARSPIGMQLNVSLGNRSRLVPITSNWTRYSVAIISSLASSAFSFSAIPTVAGGPVDFELYGVQIESGSLSSSYIPTTGVAGTRAASYYGMELGYDPFTSSDDVSLFVNSLFNFTESTYIISATSNSSNVSANYNLMSYSYTYSTGRDGAKSTNYFRLFRNSSSTARGYLSAIMTGPQAPSIGPSFNLQDSSNYWDANQPRAVAWSYDSNSASLVDGLFNPITDLTLDPHPTNQYITPITFSIGGSDFASGGRNFEGHIKYMFYYRKRIDDEVLKYYTSSER